MKACILTSMTTYNSKMTKEQLLQALQELEEERKAEQEKLVVFSTRIPESLRDAVKDAHHHHRMSMQDFVKNALNEYLNYLKNNKN